MKKLLVFLTFVFCVGFVSAQTATQLLNQIGRAPVKTAKPKGKMRVFSKEGEEVVTNFPSSLLTVTPKIHIVFPLQDKNVQARTPSVYIISDEELDTEKIKNMYPDFWGKYFFVNVKIEEGEQNFIPFLTNELLPYIEVNYSVLSNPQDRTLIAKNSFALTYLANLKEISAYLKNAALGFEYSSSLPEIDTEKGLTLWVDGPVDVAASLHAKLSKLGLVYLEDFAYNISTGKLTPGSANLDFLFNKENRKITKIKTYQQFNTLNLNKDFASLFWLNLRAKGGYSMAYIPQEVRIAPPLLNWNQEQASFNIISGASEGKIKISGKTEFGTKFKAEFNIIDSGKQVKN